MAAQRQAVAQPVAHCPSPVQGRASLSPPQSNLISGMKNTAVADTSNGTDTNELKREAERQTLFQKEADKGLHVPNGYRRVQVLIIRWNEKIDDFPGHTEEIERLRKIFTDDFGYSCRIESIGDDKPPQLVLNTIINSFILENYEEDSLNIVYYTGHGSKDERSEQLRLSATENLTETQGLFPPVAFWNEAEESLVKNAVGDALAILDCCFASRGALKTNSTSSRAYELLAASAPDGYTNGPGGNSFTKALCDSLQELLKESKGETFPVIQLQERINAKRSKNASLIWDRLKQYKRHVTLGRLDNTTEPDILFQNSVPEKSSLLLRLGLEVDDLENEQIVELARRLPTVCKEIGVRIRKLEWVKMGSRKPITHVRQAVEYMMNRRNRNGGLLVQSSSSETRIRIRPSTNPLVPTIQYPGDQLPIDNIPGLPATNGSKQYSIAWVFSVPTDVCPARVWMNPWHPVLICAVVCALYMYIK